MSFSDPSILGLFLVTLVVASILFFCARKCNKDERGNIVFVTENVRILFTFFAVFGAIFNIRSYISEVRLDNAKEYIEAYGSLAKDSYQWEKGRFCVSLQYVAEKDEKLQKQAESVCEFLSKHEPLFSNMDVRKISNQWFELPLPQNCERCPEVKKDIQESLKRVKEISEEIDGYEGKKKRGLFEELLFMFSPWLIAIICALSLFKLYNDKFIKSE